jgi:hypothetical protein
LRVYFVLFPVTGFICSSGFSLKLDREVENHSEETVRDGIPSDVVKNNHKECRYSFDVA